MASLDKYPKPSLTVDIVVLCWDGSTIHIPLIRRGHDPFAGLWAIPGGFLDVHETLEEAARRELREETGLEVREMVRGPIFDAVDRDPRGRVISVPHVSLVPLERVRLEHGSDAEDVRLFPMDSLPVPLAFDHDVILRQMFAFAADSLRTGDLGRGFPRDVRERAIDILLEGSHDE